MVTAIPRIALSVGVNRIVVGKAIPYPFGDPSLTKAREHAYRRQVVQTALTALGTEVDGPTVFEVRPVPMSG